MAAFKQCEFFLLRYVPDAVKDEFVNIGVVLVEPGANGAGYADVRFTRDWQRVKCLDPVADLEMLEGLEDDLRTRLEGCQPRGVSAVRSTSHSRMSCSSRRPRPA